MKMVALTLFAATFLILIIKVALHSVCIQKSSSLQTFFSARKCRKGMTIDR